jgi:hypothetical protein
MAPLIETDRLDPLCAEIWFRSCTAGARQLCFAIAAPPRTFRLAWGHDFWRRVGATPAGPGDLIAQHSASGYAIRNFADNHNFGHHEQSRYPAKR